MAENSKKITKIFQWAIVVLSLLFLILAIAANSFLSIIILIISIIFIIPFFDNFIIPKMKSVLEKKQSNISPNLYRFLLSIIALSLGVIILIISIPDNDNKTENLKNNTEVTKNEDSKKIDPNIEKGKKLFSDVFKGKVYYLSKDENDFKLCWKNQLKSNSTWGYEIQDDTKIYRIVKKLGNKFIEYEFKKYINDYTIEVLHTYPNNYQETEKWFLKKPQANECKIQ